MDNISVFDRSHDVPDGWVLEQSDATSWMAFFCLSMLKMALELARLDDAWDDAATTFTERFVAIAEAMDAFGPDQTSLWNDEDGFYYDVLVKTDGSESQKVRVRSLVGLLPLLAVAVAPDWVASELTDYTARLRWLQRRFPGRLAELLTATPDEDGAELTFAIVPPDRFARMLGRMFDEAEFYGPHGIRSLSAAYRDVTYDLERRLIDLFRLGPDGRRPGDPYHQPTGPLWAAHPTFSEYFDGDTGVGLGAAHQTGWTALVAHLICSL